MKLIPAFILTVINFSGSFAAINFDDYKKFVHPQDSITSIAADENFIWIGTNNGFLRIDKSSNKRGYYCVKNSVLPSDFITSICCRKNGDTWIATPKGILRYDRYAFLTITTENSELPENNITSITEDVNENLWVGTREKGLVKICGNKFMVYTAQNSNLLCDSIYSLGADGNGNLKIVFFKNVPAQNNFVVVSIDAIKRKEKMRKTFTIFPFKRKIMFQFTIHLLHDHVVESHP
jgi:ligand-binding sensor domain-containing protein